MSARRKSASKTYGEKLRDPRWQKKRLEVLERAGWQCEACGSEDRALNVHHGYYERGLDPWDYDLGTLWVLCDGCHEKAGRYQTKAHRLLAQLHPFLVPLPIVDWVGSRSVLSQAVDLIAFDMIEHGMPVESALSHLWSWSEEDDRANANAMPRGWANLAWNVAESIAAWRERSEERRATEAYELPLAEVAQ